MSHSSLLGGVLLIVGTSIGAGMLALPIATASLGFLGATTLFVICWCVMTAAAFLLLEVNLWLPANSNLISMAKRTIGPFGQLISWVTYLILLYALLCAYIAGGSDLVQLLLNKAGFSLPQGGAALLFTAIFGLIVAIGIHTVDYVNRAFMTVKLVALVLLIGLLMLHIAPESLEIMHTNQLTNLSAWMITLTSFGYAIVVPSLRVYFKSNVKQIRLALFIGSFIPLVCYLAWTAVVQGVIPQTGENSLFMVLKSPNTTSALVTALNSQVTDSHIPWLVNLFTSISVVTSFLGVSLCLSDFMADGLQIEKKGAGLWVVALITFVPPLVLVWLSTGLFVAALEYAGICCAVLLILLPAWMAWCGRYRHAAHVLNTRGTYRVRGGRLLLLLIIGVGLLLIARGTMGAWFA